MGESTGASSVPSAHPDRPVYIMNTLIVFSVLLTVVVCYNPQLKECLYMCPMNWDPVCGSDGVTYANECGLNGAVACSGRDIEIASKGVCGLDQPKRSSPPGPNERCPRWCNRMYKPVCGSDGNTYGNACVLRAAACQPENEGLRQVSATQCPQQLQQQRRPDLVKISDAVKRAV